MDISIIILNTNDREYLEGCLESLKNCCKTRQVEIIVSDNASNDGSIEMVESKFPQVKLVKNKENLGFTKGNNVAIKVSRGKYVYLLNSDIKVFEGCIDALADFLDQHPDVALAGPKILNRDLTLQCNCRKDPTLWNNFCSVSGLASLFRDSAFFCGEQMFYFKGDRTADMEILVGCFSAIRREAIDAVGLLDEGFFMYGDELDWCRRFRQAGWRIVFYPGAQAIHYYATSTTKRDPVRFAVLQQNSVLYYWKKYHNFAGQVGIRLLLIFRLTSRWLTAFLKSVLAPESREENRTRMRVSVACLCALWAGKADPAGPSQAGNAAVKPTVPG
jgi:GT2 family glycosyltransferase